MKQLITLAALTACLMLGPVSAAETVSADKVKELKEQCAKGDQFACTELEFLSD